MTTEEAIEILSDVGDINRCCAEDAEALDMALEVLEAESENVFAKIKAEIMKLDYIDEDKVEGTNIEPMVFRDDVLEIIDKCKAESEDKE